MAVAFPEAFPPAGAPLAAAAGAASTEDSVDAATVGVCRSVCGALIFLRRAEAFSVSSTTKGFHKKREKNER